MINTNNHTLLVFSCCTYYYRKKFSSPFTHFFWHFFGLKGRLNFFTFRMYAYGYMVPFTNGITKLRHKKKLKKLVHIRPGQKLGGPSLLSITQRYQLWPWDQKSEGNDKWLKIYMGEWTRWACCSPDTSSGSPDDTRSSDPWNPWFSIVFYFNLVIDNGFQCFVHILTFSQSLVAKPTDLNAIKVWINTTTVVVTK